MSSSSQPPENGLSPKSPPSPKGSRGTPAPISPSSASSGSPPTKSGASGSARAERAPKPASPPPDPVEQFRLLVANMGKGHRPAVPVRTGGFVTVVRTAQSLEPLQAATQSMPRDYRCITLRYGVNSPQAFGTIIEAALRDLATVLDGAEGEVLGSVRPARGDIVWTGLRGGLLHRFLAGRPRPAQGALDAAAFRDLFLILTDPTMLQPGMRLVIFGEVAGADRDRGAVAAWKQAVELLFRQLPERVGLVLSGAPQGFALPDDPVHFLEIPELPGAAHLAGAEAAAPGQSAAQFSPAELLSDVPTSEDHLDREVYAASLASFLMHPETAPPITIGLYGRWGTGKSSFFELLRRKLIRSGVISQLGSVAGYWCSWISAPATRWRQGRRGPVDELVIEGSNWAPVGPWEFPWSVAERLAQRRIVTVSFNAWQYDDARQTWAGLASTIGQRLEKALPAGRRQWMRLKYAWRTNRSDLLLNFGLPVLLLVIAAVVLLPWLTPARVTELAPEGTANANPLQGLLKSVLPAGSLLLLLWAVGWRLVELLKPVSERVAGYLKRTDYRADMGYQHKVIDDLKFLLDELAAARPGCRVLVYIDDLDRCSDEKIVEILRASILILADCKLFVMFGMDTEMIQRAIVAHYEKMKVPLADPQAFAESYLRKIVQIALYLPETLPERRFSLVESMFSDAARQAYRERGEGNAGRTQSTAGPGVGALPYDLSSIRRLVRVETVEDTADELAALAEFKDYLPDNARELKRFVNTHRFLKILLSASGSSWSGGKQQALVKWLLFCTNWPDRVDHVLGHARAHPDAADCLKPACTAAGWDEELGHFPDLGAAIPATELLGDFDLAARLSQVVEFGRPVPSAAREDKVQLPGPVVGVGSGERSIPSASR